MLPIFHKKQKKFIQILEIMVFKGYKHLKRGMNYIT